MTEKVTSFIEQVKAVKRNMEDDLAFYEERLGDWLNEINGRYR